MCSIQARSASNYLPVGVGVGVGIAVSKSEVDGVGAAVFTSVGVGVAVSLKPETVGVGDELEVKGSISVEVEKTRVGNKVAVATLSVIACEGNKAVEVAISARDSLVFYLPTVEATYLFREVAEEVAEEMTEETTYNWPSH